MERLSKDKLFAMILECCGKQELLSYEASLHDISFKSYKFQRLLTESTNVDINVDTIRSHQTVGDLINTILRMQIEDNHNHMENEEMTDITEYFLKKGRSCFKQDYVHCFVYPQISEQMLHDIRNKFCIERSETILLCYGNFFIRFFLNGVVVTNEGIYCRKYNEENVDQFHINWGDVHHVEYQELMLYFLNAQGENIAQCAIDYFAEDPSNPMQFGQRLASLFTEMAQFVKSPVEKAVQEAKEISDRGDTNIAIQKLQNYLEQVSDSDRWYVYYNIANLFFHSNNMKETVRNCTLGLKFCEESSSAHVKLATLRSTASTKTNDYKSARVDCFDVLQYATNEECNGKGCKNYATNNFSIFDERFSEDFLSLPYNERKVILPVREYIDLHQKSMAVIKLDTFPKIDLPIGHPAANQLYVGHPLIPSKYMQFENYQLELVEDRVREFCTLVQSLGAIEINIETVNAFAKEENTNVKANGSFEIACNPASMKVNGKKDFSHRMIDELTKTISLHQTFEPTGMPTLPSGLVWYQNEPSWQRLYTQRVNGGLISHEERIETKKNQMLEGRELSEIKGELKILFNKMGVEMTSEDENKFVQQENAIIAVKVKFAPISQTADNHNIQVGNEKSSNYSITQEEQEYLNEYKEIIADGEISDRDRRFWEKIKNANGINDKRARELEDMLTAKLSFEEQEYLDEYREMILDGEISPRDQRFLNKLKVTNGISDERASELEKLV